MKWRGAEARHSTAHRAYTRGTHGLPLLRATQARAEFRGQLAHCGLVKNELMRRVDDLDVDARGEAGPAIGQIAEIHACPGRLLLGAEHRDDARVRPHVITSRGALIGRDHLLHARGEGLLQLFGLVVDVTARRTTAERAPRDPRRDAGNALLA